MTFKDGDVISNGNGFVFILNGSGKLRTSLYVAVYPDGNITFGGAAHGNEIHLSKLVTETEKQKLIDKLKSSKKPKAKEYLKRFFGIEVKQEYEFKPFDKVLVRKDDNDFWRADFFSNMEDGKYCCVGYFWEQCIPYEGNEHLLGTIEKPE